MKPIALAQFTIVADPDTDVDIDIDEIIYMEEHPSTSTSTSGSSTSDSDEGGDGDGADAGADSETRTQPTRGGLPADETAFADSSVAFKPAKPAVPSRGIHICARMYGDIAKLPSIVLCLPPRLG